MNIRKLFNKSLRFFLYYGIFLFGLFSNNKKKINEEKDKKKKKQNKKTQTEHGILSYEEVR